MVPQFYDVVLASNYLGQNMQCVFSNYYTRQPSRHQQGSPALQSTQVPGQAQADSPEPALHQCLQISMMCPSVSRVLFIKLPLLQSAAHDYLYVQTSNIYGT